MNDADFFLGKFDLIWDDDGDPFYLAVFPQIVPAPNEGLMPSGNYFIYGVQPWFGSCFFILEQDENCQWQCERPPGYVSLELIEWLGLQIESRNK